MLEAVSVALHAVRVSENEGRRDNSRHRSGHDWSAHPPGGEGRGASRVLVADIDRTRLETAKNIGADENTAAFR